MGLSCCRLDVPDRVDSKSFDGRDSSSSLNQFLMASNENSVIGGVKTPSSSDRNYDPPIDKSLPRDSPKTPRDTAPVPGQHGYKEGWMKKRGHVRKNWKRRFFVMSEGVLRYFSDIESARSAANIPLPASNSGAGSDNEEGGNKTGFKGQLRLVGATLESIPASTVGIGSEDSKKLVIQLSEEGSSGRTLVVDAQSGTDHREWTKAIQAEIRACNIDSLGRGERNTRVIEWYRQHSKKFDESLDLITGGHFLQLHIKDPSNFIRIIPIFFTCDAAKTGVMITLQQSDGDVSGGPSSESQYQAFIRRFDGLVVPFSNIRAIMYGNPGGNFKASGRLGKDAVCFTVISIDDTFFTFEVETSRCRSDIVGALAYALSFIIIPPPRSG